VPTAGNNVFLDANSTRDCPLNSDGDCDNITVSGYTGTLNINGRTLTVNGVAYIVGGTINISGASNIIISVSSIIRPTTVTGAGTWSFPLTAGIVLKADRNINLGNVVVTGGAYTLTVDQDAANGGLTVNNLTSTANITSTSSAYLDAAAWNLTNCTLTAGSNVYFRGGVTFSSVTVGATGTFIITDDGSYDFDGATFPNLSTDVGAEITASVTAGFSTFGTMTLRPNDIISFSNSGIFNFNDIAWNGSSGNQLAVQPISPGNWTLVVNTASPIVTYVTATYSNAALGSTIDASDGTSVDGGNNTNWLFPSSSSSSCSSSSCSSSESFSSSSSSSESVSSSSCSSSESVSSSSCSSSNSLSSSCSSSLSSSSSISLSSSCSSSESLSSSSSSSESFSSCSSCSSSSSFSSSSFSSCSCSSSSISGSSFTALEKALVVEEEEDGVLFLPESKIEDFMYNPFKGVPKYNFNRGFALGDNSMGRYEELTRDAIGNAFTGLMRYPGIIDQRTNI